MRVPPAGESAWKAGDAGSEPEAPLPASTPSTVARAARLELRVTRAGRPEPGATVELLHEPDSNEPALIPLSCTRTCDERGSLALALAAGTVRAVAWSAETCALPASVTLVAGGTARLELELEPSFPVTGRVVEATTGAPIAGARVSFWTFAEHDTVVSGPDGSFQHPRFPPHAPAQQIAARAPGHGLAVRYLRVTGDGAWRLSAAAPDERSTQGTGTPWIEIQLVPEAVVRGRVVDEEGRGLAGVRITAEGFFHAMPAVAVRDSAATASDAEGRFELGGLRSDVGHSLLFEASGHAHELLELAAGATRHELGTLTLTRETVLTGVALDADGVPLADVEVVLHLAASGSAPEARGALDVVARIQGRERRTRTTPEGTFFFEHLARVPVLLTLESEDARAELALEPRADGSFDSPCLTLLPTPAALAGPAR